MTNANGPTCEFCPRPATHFRAYEGETPDRFLCLDCVDAKDWQLKVWPIKDHPNNPENNPQECDKCDGTGLVEGVGPCWHCKGYGVVGTRTSSASDSEKK